MAKQGENAQQGKDAKQKTQKKGNSDRRGFLKIAATGAAALVAQNKMVAARPLPPAQQAAATPEPETAASAEDILTTERPGSDFMADVIKKLGVEYVTSNPGSSFRSLHESIANYGGNSSPEFLTCCHEESSVAMAHGYFKIEGKPLIAMAHGTVGLQHASMAVYNAYADRVLVYLVLGNTLDATDRRPGAEWYHSVQDASAMVRDYTKWDDNPVSLAHFAESAIRAYKLAMTPPMGPVVLVADSALQERPMPEGPRARGPASPGSPSPVLPRATPAQCGKPPRCSLPPKIPSSPSTATPAPRRPSRCSSSSPRHCRPPWSTQAAG